MINKVSDRQESQSKSRRKSKISPRERRRAYLRVAESIRLRILTSDLKRGDRLPNENDLARDEGVGRTTVREALRLLASVGLIETKRGARGGAFVRHPGADDLYNQMTTTLSLMASNGELGDTALGEAVAFTMPMVARIASLRGTVEEMATLVKIPASLLATKSEAEWVDTARQFSSLLIDMSRNSVITMILKPLMWITLMREGHGQHTAGWRRTPDWREQTARRYQELADAVSRRAPAAAEKAMLRLRQQYLPHDDESTPSTGVARKARE